jgi:zinc transporter 9
VGTSLIVIIPEGIEAAASSTVAPRAHKVRSLVRRSPWTFGLDERDIIQHVTTLTTVRELNKAGPGVVSHPERMHLVVPPSIQTASDKRDEHPADPAPTDGDGNGGSHNHEDESHKQEGHVEIPGFGVGFAMVLGFILMFLIDRLPKHATDNLQSGSQPQHFSLGNLGGNASESASVDEEEGFLGSLTPTPKHTKTLATTIGLVIHAAADGIAMGASSATANVKLGFIIFFAIMIHKAPAAFGLTSVLLRQGLSKRATRGHLVFFSLAAPVGALSTWFMIKLLGGDHLEGESGTWWTGMLLLFSGGTFL